MIKSLLHPLVLFRNSFFICLGLLSFVAQSNTAQDYEKALISFNKEEFKASYIHLKNALQQSPEHLPSKLLIGRIFLIDGYPDAAITEFEEVVQAGADINLVVLPLANAYFMKGYYQKLIDLDIPVSAKQTTQLDLYLLKANASIQLNDYPLAESLFQQAKNKFDNDIRVNNGLAQIALLDKNFAKARTLVNQSQAFYPSNAQSKLISGLIYQAAAQYPQALAEFESAYQLAPEDNAVKRALASSYAQLGSISKAMALVEEIQVQSPGSLQTKLLKARLLAMSKENEEADLLLTELSQTLSLADKGNPRYISKLSLVAGITAHLNLNYDVSVRELSRFLNNEEPTVGIVAMLAEGHIRLNNFKAATQLLERYEGLVLDNIQIASLSCDLYLSSNNIFKCDSLVKELKSRHGEATELLLLEAKLLNHRKRPLAALEILNSKLANSRESDIILFRTGLLARLGRYEEAAEDARALLITSAKNLDYLNLNIDLLIRMQEFEQANELLEKVLQQEPNNIAGLIHQSRIRFANTDLAGAKRSIQKVLSLDKGNFAALLLSGQILIKQNKLDDAINQLIAAKTINTSSNSPRELLVSIYKQQNQYDLAISELDQLLKLRRSEADYIFEKAKLYLTMDQPVKAKRQLDMLYFQWTEQPEKLVQLSRLQLKNNDIEGATSSLVTAQAQAPRYLAAQLEYTKLLLIKQAFVEAGTLIEKMQKAYPDNPNVHLAKGHYYKEVGDLENAYQQYLEAHSLSENFTAALIELYKLASQGVRPSEITSLFEQLVEFTPQAHFSRHLYADLLFLQDKMVKANAHYVKLILVEDLPNKGNVYNNLAIINSEKDIEKALNYSAHAVSLSPNSPSILDTQGWLHTKNNDLQQGLDILRQAFTLDSDNPTIRYHLGVTLYELGREQEAKSELESALSSAQGFKEKARAEALLREL